jgi:hypothetical protein
MEWKYGTTRRVLLTCGLAIKFPATNSWRNFLYGIIANGNEYRFSSMDCDLLAKVVWRSWLDLIIVMKKAEVKSYSDADRFEFLDGFLAKAEKSEHSEMIFNIVEHKICSVGLIDGKLVAIDYGS